MKRKIIVVLALACFAAFCAWGYHYYYNRDLVLGDGDTVFTLILHDSSTENGQTRTINYATDATTLMCALEEMIDDGLLSALEGSSGFITSIDILENKSGEAYYVFMYTSYDNEIFLDVSEWASDAEFEGATYRPCGKGANEMPIVEGVVYYITYIYYG